MQQTPGVSANPGATPSQSPFSLAQGQNVLASTPTFDTLITQTQAAQNALGGIKTQLNTPNLKLKASQKYLLKNKLSDANGHLRSANSKLGGEPGPEPETPAGGGPVNKFLAYITDGQNQINGAKLQLQQMKDQGGVISPGDMLLVQIKINKAQQEIEYASVLLSKAVDDLKTLMNIQL
jgi:hypothetical protein